MGMNPELEAELKAKAEAARQAHQRPITVKLAVPVEWGKETVEELTLKPCAGAFEGFSMMIEMSPSGTRLSYEPFRFAQVAVAMTDRPPSFTKKLSIEDMNTLAGHAMGFFMPSLGTGLAFSP